MLEFSQWLLLLLSSLMGVHTLPEMSQGAWKLVGSGWQQQASGFPSLEMHTEHIASQCRANPESTLVFPMVIQGAHELTFDRKNVLNFGDPTFNRVRSFYGSPSIPCRDLLSTTHLRWKVVSFTQYFARVQSLPRLTAGQSWHNVLAESLQVFAGGTLLFIGVFSVACFYGKVAHKLLTCFALANLFLALYFLASVPELLNIPASMLSLHKAADMSLWVGIGLLLYTLHWQGLVSRFQFTQYCLSLLVANSIILLANHGDIVQLGTTIPFVTLGIALGGAVIGVVRKLFSDGFTRAKTLSTCALVFFAILSFSDMIVVLGLYEGTPLLCIGVMGSQLFSAMSINEQITQTYRERDFLRENLQAEVKRKTEGLENALLQLQSTQAELIQSAKLAALGTLSAGIAHEINNSLNYVNGAIKPLENILLKDETQVGFDRTKVQKLLGVMKEGLSITFEIMTSLRQYSASNKAPSGDIPVAQTIHAVLRILQSRVLDNVTVKADVSKSLVVSGNVAGFNQILMNLISNALDAMSKGGTLTIAAAVAGSQVEITVADTGTGIGDEIAQRIFDPFFTTKGVGKGTGLGLHIVRSEVERNGGKISMQTKLGEGTAFTFSFPRVSQTELAV